MMANAAMITFMIFPVVDVSNHQVASMRLDSHKGSRLRLDRSNNNCPDMPALHNHRRSDALSNK